MAISTYKTFLMYKNNSDWEKLIDIKDFPDIGGKPEMIDTTTLTDRMKTSIPGIQSIEALEFTANYTLSEYKKLKALDGVEKEYSIWLGGTELADDVTPTGKDGKYSFRGRISIYVAGGGVNDVVNLKISLAPSSPIVLES